MSDESGQRDSATEQQSAAVSACPHPEAVGTRWGDLISGERQAELQGYLDRWQAEPDHGQRKGPFDHAVLFLTGSDAYWLAEQSAPSSFRGVPRLHLEGANLVNAHLEGADLADAHLEGADLGAGMFRYGARLQRASLRGAHLEGAKLIAAELEGANLSVAHLEGANLSEAHLEGANISAAWLDSKTELTEAVIDQKTCLGDIHWSGVGTIDLTQINWGQIPTLGDEQGLKSRSNTYKHEDAVRAYRQLAAQLRAQGLSEVADRFSERAQIRQRKLLFRQLLADWRRPWRIPDDLLRWLFSGFLAVLAGYGYHPGRTLLWYLAVISGFAFAYGLATHGILTFGLPRSSIQPLQWYEALVLSVSSFHGRGFFQPVQSLGDPVAIIAAAEAIIGLLIEISFIATFTQRFFGR